MKKNLMRLCCLVLALVMALSMAACGKSGDASEAAPSGSAKKPAATAAPEFVYAAEFKPLMEKSKDWMSVREYNEDGMYFTKYEKVGERPHEGETPTYEGEFDIYSSFLYFMDASGKVTKLDSYTSLPPKEDDQGRRDYVSTADLNGICFTDDGFVTIEYVATSWVEGDAKKNSEEYWQDQKYTQDYYIRWFDKQGNELSCAPVDVPADTWLRGYNMQLDSKGNVVVANDQGLRAIAPDGTDAYTIQTDGWIDNLISMPDGRIGVSIYGEQMMLCFLDDEAGKLKDGVELNFDLYNAVPGDSNYDFYFSNGSNFYGMKLGEEPEKLFNWINCDVNGNNITVLDVTDDGRVVGLSNEWDSADQSYSYELVTMKQVPYDSVPHKETIRMAVMNIDYRMQEMLIKFNRKNDKYRIEVADYSEYNNDKDGWDAGMTKLNTEVLSGNVPDIFCLQGMNYRQLASKGILEDLYPYIDSDKELKRSDFFENVLKAMEVDGKLCQTVSGFYINSAVGAASVVGDEPGWTYDEFNAALNEMRERVPECTAFDQYMTRDGALQTCLALDMADFVDWESGEVSFDSEQFVELLEFANSFPTEFDWENYTYSESDDIGTRLSQGLQMLAQTSAYSIEDIFYNNYAPFLGGKITYIGYPTAHGTGNMISLAEASYGISSKSPYKDVAWEFLRNFFTKEYQQENYNLSSRIDVFEQKAEEATTIQYQKDSDGKFLLDEDGEKIPIVRFYMNDGKEVYNLEPEQVQQIRDLIESTTKVADYNQEILDIVSEQAAPFFAGQKSAEEVARLVQSKANIYVNEQR